MVINGQATFVRMSRVMGGRIVPVSEEEQMKLFFKHCNLKDWSGPMAEIDAIMAKYRKPNTDD